MNTVLDKFLIYKRGLFIFATLITIMFWFASYYDASCWYYFSVAETIQLFPGVMLEVTRLTKAVSDVALSGLFAVLLTICFERLLFVKSKLVLFSVSIFFFIIGPLLVIKSSQAVEPNVQIFNIYYFYGLLILIYSAYIIFFFDHILLKYQLIIIASLVITTSLSQGLLAGLCSLVIGLVMVLLSALIVASIRLITIKWF